LFVCVPRALIYIRLCRLTLSVTSLVLSFAFYVCGCLWLVQQSCARTAWTLWATKYTATGRMLSTFDLEQTFSTEGHIEDFIAAEGRILVLHILHLQSL